MKKMIIVRQTEIKDCGACSLQSVIRYYDGYVSLEKIRQDTYTSLEGTTVFHLKKAAEKYGFDVLAKKDLDYTFQNQLPVIVHVQYENGLCHFMVVYECHQNKLIIMDPSKGKVIMSRDDFNKIFTGVVIELSPKHSIVLQQKGTNIYSLFIRIIKSNKNIIIRLFIASILLIIFTIISGFYFKVLYEQVGNINHSFTIFLIYIFLLFMLLKTIYSFIRNYYLNIINKNIDVQLFSDFIQHLFKIPLKTISTRTTGEIVSRVNELWEIKSLFSQIFLSGTLDMTLSVSSMIVLFIINRQLSIILIIYIVIYVLVSLLFSPYLYKRLLGNIEYHTVFNTTFVESVDMINSIKNLGMTKESCHNIEKKLCHTIYDSYSFNNTYNYFELFRTLIDELLIFIISTYSFYLIVNDQTSLISVFIFNSLMAYFVDPIKNLISVVPKYNFLRASFNKICDYVDIKEEHEGDLSNFANGDIKFENITYSYNDYYKVLNDFNIVIKMGDKIMIKGPSGCGKSTLCKLLNRDITPQHGSITINDKNIMDYSLKTIKHNITYVGQKERLYTDTIKNNIMFFRKNNQLFDKVCKICCLESIVEKKPLRYESGVSNDATNISGGEKQRIVLARALLNNSKILILDEALSEVDYDLERDIINNINIAFPDKTIIYVSHKNQTDLFKKVVYVG